MRYSDGNAVDRVQIPRRSSDWAGRATGGHRGSFWGQRWNRAGAELLVWDLGQNQILGQSQLNLKVHLVPWGAKVTTYQSNGGKCCPGLRKDWSVSSQ